jgi:hypothetical protein
VCSLIAEHLDHLSGLGPTSRIRLVATELSLVRDEQKPTGILARERPKNCLSACAYER